MSFDVTATSTFFSCSSDLKSTFLPLLKPYMTTSLAHSGAAAFRPPFPKNLPSNIMQTSGHKCFVNSQKIAYIKTQKNNTGILYLPIYIF